jgi:hypothetical protein
VTQFNPLLQGPAPKRARRGLSAKGLASSQPDLPSTYVDAFEASAAPDVQQFADPASAPISRAESQGRGEDEASGKEATLPLKVDTVVRAKWLDGAYHLARVVSTRLRPGAKDETDKEYYMHFINMNRRMDTWVTADAMDLSWHEMDAIDERRCAVLCGPASCGRNARI